ncbi:MAG: DEAD/DEAH box helicase, partial [Halalkalicoccus sp.]
MGGRELLASRGVDPAKAEDLSVLDSLSPPVRRWWVAQFGEYVPENGGVFTPPQREAIPLVREGENALICAPTGSGKTLASFTAVIDDLIERDRRGTLENSVYCLYVSPLKSLANDIHRNLEVPLSEIADE